MEGWNDMVPLKYCSIKRWVFGWWREIVQPRGQFRRVLYWSPVT